MLNHLFDHVLRDVAWGFLLALYTVVGGGLRAAIREKHDYDSAPEWLVWLAAALWPLLLLPPVSRFLAWYQRRLDAKLARLNRELERNRVERAP